MWRFLRAHRRLLRRLSVTRCCGAVPAERAGHAHSTAASPSAARSPRPWAARTTSPTSTTPTTSTTRCGMFRAVAVGGLAPADAGWRSSARSAPRISTSVRPYAAYVRVRPWRDRAARHPGRPDPAVVRRLRPPRLSGTDNPLIGYPLAYQYLTSIRPDAVPATAADLLGMRGARLADRTIRSGRTSRRPASRSSPRSAGTPASRRTGKAALVDVTGGVTTGTLVRSAGGRTTTAASRSPDASPSSPCRAGPRRLGGARRVPRRTT